MKATYLVVAALALPATARAGEIDPATVQLWDVVTTTEGTVLKGVIVEELPGTSVRVLVLGGSSIVVPIGTVVSFGKELNPGFANPPARTTAPAAAAGAADEPAMKATSGLRIALLPGVAFHEDLSTFLLTTRLGWEIGLDRWGLTPGLGFDFMPEVGSYGAHAGSLMAGVRAAYRGSTVSPFFGFGVGPDFVGDDVSLGVSMTGGIELVLHRRFALTGEAKYHRGFADSSYITTLSYGSIAVGAELRL